MVPRFRSFLPALWASLLMFALGGSCPALAQTTGQTAGQATTTTARPAATGKDTTEVKPRFDVAKTAPDTEDDMQRKTADLKTPENIKTEATYDEKTHTYTVGTKIGDTYLNVPFLMSPEQYQQWSR